MFSIVAYAIIVNIYAPAQGIFSAELAALQFDNSNMRAVASTIGMHSMIQLYGVFSAVLAAVLVFIWYKPFLAMLKKNDMLNGFIVLALSGAVLSSVLPSPAYAYYDKNDYTEGYTILPNESAIFIPDQGDNKNGQAKFDSLSYLNENKVAAKFFIIPHKKLAGSGYRSDYYVPAGRLYIIDRTTFSREWVDAHDRGSSAKKEGFVCQSKEGINITTGVAVGVRVSESDAAKYFYNFGVQSPTGNVNRSDPQFIFQSVYYSRKVADVMDDVGSKKIGSLICREVGKRGFLEANASMDPIMQTVEKEARAYFEGVGITMDFIGWADTFNFDPHIQEVVNRVFEAQQNQIIATLLEPHVKTIQGVALAEALRGAKLSLPTTYVGNPMGLHEMIDTLMINGSAGVSGPVKPAPKTGM